MSDAHRGRHLAAIVFTDIVNFSAIVHRDEVMGERLLNRQRAVVERIRPRFKGRDIGTAGDANLIEFDSALAAVSAVIAIQQELARENARHPNDPPVCLRISVHLGDVEHRGSQVYGDGVNVASRLNPFSPEGGLCLSSSVRALVRQRLSLPLRSIGAPPLKNIDEPIDIFVVDPTDVLAISLDEDAPPPGSRRWPWAAAAVSGCGLLAALLWFSALDTSGQPSPETHSQPSIAVLPFENRSPDADNAFFADGIQDEILARLARIGSLKVVSRSSSHAYGPNPDDPRQVAAELGVGFLMQGSVQRVGQRVRISVQLFDPVNHVTRWAELYDRDLADILSVQSEVASHVVEALDAKLAGAERLALSQLPTRDTGAYDAYLRARFYQARAETTPENFNNAVYHFERAVGLDPTFALAWAQLSYMHSQIYWFQFDATPARLHKAENAGTTAAKLQADLGEGFLARGFIRYWGYQDYAGALDLFAQAQRRLPNDSQVLMAQSYVKRRQGEWEAALDLQARALERDPRNPQSLQQYAATLMMMPGRLADSLQAAERGLNVLPDDPDLLASKIAVLQAQGDLESAAPLLQQRAPRPADYTLFVNRAQQWLYERKPTLAIEALQAAIAQAGAELGAGIGLFYVLLVQAQELSGNRTGASAACREGIAALVKLRVDGFDSGRLALDLAALHAGLGDARRARLELDKADKALAADQLDGPSSREVRARVEARLGNIEAAMDLIEPLLRTTYSSIHYGPPLTPALLRLDPAWDALHKEPRYQALANPSSLVGQNTATPVPDPARR